MEMRYEVQASANWYAWARATSLLVPVRRDVVPYEMGTHKEGEDGYHSDGQGAKIQFQMITNKSKV